jgi:hypothetical protein
VTIGADDITLGHFGFDLVPGAVVCDQACDAAELQSSDVVPVQTAGPTTPPAVSAAEGKFDGVVTVLKLKASAP